MQELLTGKTRLPGFSDEWELKTIGADLKNMSNSKQNNIVNDPRIWFNLMNTPVIDST